MSAGCTQDTGSGPLVFDTTNSPYVLLISVALKDRPIIDQFLYKLYKIEEAICG